MRKGKWPLFRMQDITVNKISKNFTRVLIFIKKELFTLEHLERFHKDERFYFDIKYSTIFIFVSLH